MKILRAIGFGVLTIIAFVIIANILFAVHKQSVAREFEKNLSDTPALAEKSKDPEAIRVAKYLQDNMSPALAAGIENGRIIVMPFSLYHDGRQYIVTIPPGYLKGLKNGSAKIDAWYDSATKNIYLISEERASDLDVPISLLHEGEHALRLRGKGTVEVSIPEEIAAYDLQFRVLEAIGGEPWKDARKNALSKLMSGKESTIRSCEVYDPRLDLAFGPAKNEACRKERQLMLCDAAIWYKAGLKGNSSQAKAKIVKAIYGGQVRS